MGQGANTEIRIAARQADVPLWKLAQKMGISESTMTRSLRNELPAEQKQKYIRLIAEIAEGGE